MPLPVEVAAFLQEQAATAFTGSIELNYKDGRILSYSRTETKRIRETHASPVSTQKGDSRG